MNKPIIDKKKKLKLKEVVFLLYTILQNIIYCNSFFFNLYFFYPSTFSLLEIYLYDLLFIFYMVILNS